jgi:uncharacterized protein
MNHTRAVMAYLRNMLGPLRRFCTALLPVVERHTLLVFFSLTFAISWSIWGFESLLAGREPIAARWLGTIAPYGPTLAAMSVAGMLGPERQPLIRPQRRLWLAGMVLAGTIWLNVTLATHILRATDPLLAAALWLVVTLLPAWVVWNIFSVRRGVRTLLRTIAAWRAPLVWYLAALLLPVLISAAGIALLALLGQPLPRFPRTEPARELLPLLVTTFVATLLYGGPLGEEAGWRGFALPRLQARHSPLVASLLLSVMWGLWHLPLHLQGVYHGIFPDGLSGILLRIVSSVPTAILFTWLYNRTKGNLCLVVLLHTAVNNTAGFWLPITRGIYATMSILTVTLIIVDRMWQWQPPVRAMANAEGQVELLDTQVNGVRLRSGLSTRITR